MLLFLFSFCLRSPVIFRSAAARLRFQAAQVAGEERRLTHIVLAQELHGQALQADAETAHEGAYRP